MPTMSKSPTSASRPAAVVSAMPWSCAAGMKWVPTSPLVVAPQIAKPPASSQNGRVRAARPSARERPAGPRRRRGAGGRPASVGPRRSAVRPRSAGWSRSSHQTSGTTASAAPATVSAAARQPWCSASRRAPAGRSAGRSAPPAVSTPVTRPRCATNQRSVTVATKASAIEPVPSPTSTPQQRISCQLAVMKTVSPLPAATSSSAHGDHPADAEPVHQRGGERRGQPEEQQVDRDGERRSCRATSRTRRAAGVISTPGWRGSRPRRAARRRRRRRRARPGGRRRVVGWSR